MIWTRTLRVLEDLCINSCFKPNLQIGQDPMPVQGPRNQFWEITFRRPACITFDDGAG